MAESDGEFRQSDSQSPGFKGIAKRTVANHTCLDTKDFEEVLRTVLE